MNIKDKYPEATINQIALFNVGLKIFENQDEAERYMWNNTDWFIENGITYESIPSEKNYCCDGCVFFREVMEGGVFRCIRGKKISCSSLARGDRRDIIWAKVETGKKLLEVENDLFGSWG